VNSDVRHPVTIAASDLDARPHELFSYHRQRAPIVIRDDGVYVAMRAADIESLASNARTRQLETEYVRSRGISDGPLFDVFDNTILMSNGQDHRRRRAPVARAFAYKLIMGMRPRIREIANDLIDREYARRAMNLHDDFAARVPAMVGEVLAAVELKERLAALSARLPGMFFDGAPPLIHGSGGIRTVDEFWVCWK